MNKFVKGDWVLATHATTDGRVVKNEGLYQERALEEIPGSDYCLIKLSPIASMLTQHSDLTLLRPGPRRRKQS